MSRKEYISTLHICMMQEFFPILKPPGTGVWEWGVLLLSLEFGSRNANSWAPPTESERRGWGPAFWLFPSLPYDSDVLRLCLIYVLTPTSCLDQWELFLCLKVFLPHSSILSLWRIHASGIWFLPAIPMPSTEPNTYQTLKKCWVTELRKEQTNTASHHPPLLPSAPLPGHHPHAGHPLAGLLLPKRQHGGTGGASGIFNRSQNMWILDLILSSRSLHKHSLSLNVSSTRWNKCLPDLLRLWLLSFF